MNQLSLVLGDGHETTTTDTNPRGRKPLRDYQARISDQAVSLLGMGKSPLIVMATGTGKTRTAADVVRRMDGRVLWVAHRIELVRQAVSTLEELLGEPVGVEEPGRYSGNERVVVASKDTIRNASRLDRLAMVGEPFKFVLFDECHHSAAASYQVIVQKQPGALRIGLTATPGRLDKRPLGLYDCQTDPYGIVQAIDDGWLVPVHAQRIKVNSVDLTHVGTVAGDFNQHELDEVMRCEESIHGVAHAILSKVDVGPILSFATSVSIAERQCEILNRYRPGIARFVSGTTATDVRRQTFADFGRTYRILVNVGVATEGTDLPAAAVIAMGRPTKSQSLFQQMLGRGMRPLPGIDNATDRISWIAQSPKPKCLVLDFCNATGRHSVETAISAFIAGAGEMAGGLTQGLKGVSKRHGNGDEIDVLEALKTEAAKEQKRVKERDERRARDMARRMALRGTSERTITDAQLIGLGGVALYPDSRSILDAAPTPGQLAELAKLGISGSFESAAAARKAIVEIRELQSLATPKQLEMLQQHCPEQVTPDLTKKKAGWLISSLIKNWRRKR